MLACVFQNYTMQFLSLESNLHIPVAGAIVRLMGGIGLPEKLDGWRPVLKRIKQGLDEGQMPQIYPEGELNDGCRTLRRFSGGVSDHVLVPEADDSVPAAGFTRVFPKAADEKGRNGAGYFRAGTFRPIKGQTRGNRALETQIRCQMEAARLAVGREGA